MLISLPPTVSGYALPDGTMVSTADEYITRMASKVAAEQAEMFIAETGPYPQGQDTRTAKAIEQFLVWREKKSADGDFEGDLAAFRAQRAAELEKLKSEKKEVAKQAKQVKKAA